MPTAQTPDYHDAVEVSVRGGYSRYYSFGFYTTGIELSARAVADLHPLIGAEAYVVRRINPPAVALATGNYNDWETLVPVNVGAIYKFGDGQFQPYGGADLVFVKYTQIESKGYTAIGGRARGGLDIAFAEHLAVNANVAVGAWSGSQWSTVDRHLQNTGLIAQVSGGLVVGF